MKIQIITVGKRHDLNLEELIFDFEKRIKVHFELEWKILSSEDNQNKNIQKKKETQKICDFLKKEKGSSSNNYLILLDEVGKEKTTKDISLIFEDKMKSGTEKIIFIIGGAFGVDENTFKENSLKPDLILALSKLTFPHQIVRLILIEQIYRAISILKKGKYHHE